MELAKGPVLRSHGTFALQHVNLNRGLIVSRSRKRLRLAGRNRGVARNHRCRYAAQRFNRQGQRSHVEQKQVLDFALEHATLNGRPHCDDFVRVHALVAFFSKQLFHQLLDARHTRLSADQNHFIDLAGIHAGVFHALFAWPNRLLNDVFHHAFELGPSQFLDQVLRPAGISRDEGQIDLCLHRRRELNFGPLGCVTQTLQRHLVALATQVEAFIFLELINQPIHQLLVDVVAAQVGVAIGGFDFNHAFADFKNRNVERPTAEVVNRDGLVFLLIQTVGQRSCRRLVDDSLYIKPGDLPGIFGRLPLGVIEVRRHGDNRFRDLLAEVIFCRLFQLLKNHGGDLRRRIFLALRQHRHVVAGFDHLVRNHFDFFANFVIAPSHEALDRINRILRVGYRLAFGYLPDQPFAGFSKTHYGGSGPSPFFVRNDLGLSTFHHRHAGIGGAEIDSNNFSHNWLLSLL